MAGFETPGAEIKYPELEPGGSVKGILGGIRRWLETLKKEKVTADGGEAGETTATFEDYTGANPAPSVETALAGIRSKGKTGNILSNIKAALMGLVTLGEMRKYLVNNGLCTEPGKFFLDAAYGKTLMDEITRLNGEMSKKLNGIIIERLYYDSNFLNKVDEYCKSGESYVAYIQVGGNSTNLGSMQKYGIVTLITNGIDRHFMYEISSSNGNFIEAYNVSGSYPPSTYKQSEWKFFHIVATPT